MRAAEMSPRLRAFVPSMKYLLAPLLVFAGAGETEEDWASATKG